MLVCRSRHSLTTNIQIGVNLRLDIFVLGILLHELLGDSLLLSGTFLRRVGSLVVDLAVGLD